MKKLALVIALAASGVQASGTRVAGSKHDLSVLGPGQQRATAESNACAFCHIAHDGGPGLDARPQTNGGQRPYESSTLSRRAATPSGVSRTCLSCHDGTVAPGRTRKRTIQMSGGGGAPIASGRPANLGTDLRGSHPVSIRPAGVGRRAAAPSPGDAVKLDAAGEIQCTSCHDPHSEFGGDPDLGMFLVKPRADSQLCTACHAPEGSAGLSSHATSAAMFTPRGAAQPTTVAQAGCSACHPSHGADPRGQLLRAGMRDDDEDCLECHSGAVARENVGRDASKPWSHRSRARGAHDAAEGRTGRGARPLPETSPGTQRHVACVDCHDPHSATPSPAVAPAASGLLAGTWGIAIGGERVEEARFEYEICLKCHGDSANKPQSGGSSRYDRVRRANDDVNLRRVFDPTSPSFHPVAAPGRNPDVQSLKPTLTEASIVFCTDCHASDDGPGAGGPGARGPHGSIYPFLLERQYLTADFTPEGPASYALCYKCHEREKLLSDTSPFPHRKHVVGSAAPCSACHDAHGVSGIAGSDRENAHLVAFDLSIVRARSDAAPRYQTEGPGHGSCNLTCHDRAHDGASLTAPGRY